jgi:hypothetical protein
MKKICFFILISFCLLQQIQAQPFTKKYIMSFHSCLSGACAGPSQHMTYLAESNDGASWTLVPNFTPYQGSVPDVVIRGSKLYIFNPGSVRRYNYSTNTWDASASSVSITSGGSNVNFVDPSPIIDENGRIVLFFLNSTGVSGDPANCSSYPCDKYFESAVEVDGSDGTQFVAQTGKRYTATLSSGTASDPDIFYDGTNYYLYISKGNSVAVYKSSTLHGSYTAISTLSNSLLTNQGGIPSGMYDGTQYQTFVHANVGSTVIRRQAHSNFNSQLNSFTTIISGSSMGLGANATAESPGICNNTFLTLPVNMLSFDAIKKDNTIILQWKTASQTNKIDFVIQRSINGTSFENIGTVNGKISSQIQEYSFNDAGVVSGSLFYRIKQVEDNGKETYSKTILLNIQHADKNTFKLTPTLVQQQINLQYISNSRKKITVTIKDVAGRPLLTQQWSVENGINAKTISLFNQLTAGMYFISVFDGSEFSTQRFVKQ